MSRRRNSNLLRGKCRRSWEIYTHASLYLYVVGFLSKLPSKEAQRKVVMDLKGSKGYHSTRTLVPQVIPGRHTCGLDSSLSELCDLNTGLDIYI